MNWLLLILVVFIILNLFLFSMFPTHKKMTHTQYDACIILGSPARCDGNISRMQKTRMHQAIELYNRKKVSTLIISGGCVCNAFSEASVMCEYAIKQGVLKQDIIVEQKATNTYDNLRYSKAICEQHHFHKIIVVTSNFHVRRASFFVHKFFKDYTMAGTKEPEKICHYISEYFKLWNTIRFELFKR